VGPRNHVLDGDPVPPTERDTIEGDMYQPMVTYIDMANVTAQCIRRREGWHDKTAMRPFATLFWTLLPSATVDTLRVRPIQATVTYWYLKRVDNRTVVRTGRHELVRHLSKHNVSFNVRSHSCKQCRLACCLSWMA